MTRLEFLQEQIEKLTAERDQELMRVRRECKHLRLAELESNPPQRICMDCGAEERGWYCGYQVLATSEDITSPAPHKKDRGVFLRTSDSDRFYWHRKPGPLYPVGQSHPSFGAGRLSYAQLTAV